MTSNAEFPRICRYLFRTSWVFPLMGLRSRQSGMRSNLNSSFRLMIPVRWSVELYFPGHCINGCEPSFGADDLKSSAPVIPAPQTLPESSFPGDRPARPGVSSAPNRPPTRADRIACPLWGPSRPSENRAGLGIGPGGGPEPRKVQVEGKGKGKGDRVPTPSVGWMKSTSPQAWPEPWWISSTRRESVFASRFATIRPGCCSGRVSADLLSSRAMAGSTAGRPAGIGEDRPEDSGQPWRRRPCEI